MFASINPATEERLGSLAALDDEEVERRLASAIDGWSRWRHETHEGRAAALDRLADCLEGEAESHARRITAEMGKPITEARAEIAKCIAVCRHFATHGPGYLAEKVVGDHDLDASVRYSPLGPILAIMPWNFPYWQVFRVLAPSVVAGNMMLLKHAPNTMGCGEAIAELVDAAGLPEPLLQTLRIDHDRVPDVIADDRVRAVTFTGSVSAGRAVATLAGQAGKKSVLELGGSDPFLVLGDADVEEAAKVGATSRLMNSGQACICAKRFIVDRSIADAFTEALAAEFRAVATGDPLEAATRIGPLARADLRESLEAQVGSSVSRGAQVVLGGERPDGAGYYYPPTILADVAPGQVAAEEELFGPVASIMVVDGDAEAVRLADATPFGLGAAVWSQGPERADAVADALEAGVVAVNGMVTSDPRLPFGGVKASGYGRELGEHGTRELTNVKSVRRAR